MNQQATLPEFFEPLLAESYDEADVGRIVAGCGMARPVTLRANALISDAAEVAGALDAAGISFERVSWYGDAFVLRGARERDVWDLPVYQEGKVYLQSLSSMIPALALEARAGEDVCDMCAAPGGKTTQIAALAEGKAYITACEMHAPRAEKLRYNLEKLGAPRVTVMQVDARRMDDFFCFDRILLDAPCSGSGTVRAGDPRTAKRFTPALVQKSRKSQRALIAKALSMLKPGGTLVYSTCSVLGCENEDIVEEGLRTARRTGSFEIQPLVEGAGRETASDRAPATGGGDAGSEQGQGPAPLFDADTARELPLLPSRIEGALCLAPTDLFEGFFVAKVKRTG